MAKRLRVGTLLVIAIVVLLLGAACGNGSPGETAPTSATSGAPEAGGSRVNDEGEITVTVTWDGRSEPLVFDVALDTHSVDLDGYDLRKLAVLRAPNGQELEPSRWDAAAGGHHREGQLAFEPVASFTRDAALQLIIRDVGEVPERTFTWELGTGGS